jgi:putative transposase
MTYENADGYKIRNQEGLHFLTFTIEGWIDVFTRQRYRDIVLENMTVCREKKGLLNGAYVIMSNHIHVIWRSRNGDLSGLIRDFKSFTTKCIMAAIEKDTESRREWLQYMFQFYANGTHANKDFKMWLNNNHPEEIYSEDFLRSKLNYIHQNPVRAGWVAEPEHYLYSSASNYATGKGLIEIDFLI